jgi:hypothetical protein
MLVLPLNEYEYLVSWPAGKAGELYARGHLIEFTGQTLLQLQWLGSSSGAWLEEDGLYQVANYTVTPGGLSVRWLNPDIINRDVSSSLRLADAVAHNRGHPRLFREPVVFRKVHI